MITKKKIRNILIKMEKLAMVFEEDSKKEKDFSANMCIELKGIAIGLRYAKEFLLRLNKEGSWASIR